LNASSLRQRKVPSCKVIPCHYGSFPIIDATADKFVAAMGGHATNVIVPDKGKPVAV